MKSPDEIKKFLEYMSITNVGEKLVFLQRGYTIPYGYTVEEMCSDALALVQQLQAENSEKDARIQQLEAERDAAVRDLTEMAQDTDESCEYCEMFKAPRCSLECRMKNKGFKWRGVQKEGTP